ncbi:FG-GAP-like repeat-containing protein [Edaphobacter sp.]|uniref:FG-GAP-like repeat-containing protein n=1 Tax=Edaphobacter sp. TaxID=1934404 RepID=UPI002DB8F35B|nr:FG-GAP-like repeat-containing protein [Edaphobacter sp.]HEU5341029.1 FG-GAP-like repeat-containing protein [Edaphobacter sp.]
MVSQAGGSVVAEGPVAASSVSGVRRLCRGGMAAVLGMATLLAGCHRGLPSASSKTYRDFVSAFYTGLGALEVGNDALADPELEKATRLASGEPAAWANWGILALRQRNFDPAGERLERARSLAKDNDTIYYLLGLVEDGKGNSAGAIADLRRAIALNPKNLIATYKLADEIQRQGDADSDAQFAKLVQQIAAQRPDNLAVLLELARVSAKQGDGATLRQTVDRIRAHADGWPAPVIEQLEAVEVAAAGNDPRTAALKTTFLRNEMMQLPRFRQDLAEIKPAPGDEARPFARFLRLTTPSFTPAPADTAMMFEPQPLPNPDKTAWNWIGAVSLSDKGAPTVVEANGSVVRLATGATLPFPGGAEKVAPGPEGIVPIDFNYDFKTDLVFAGAGGVRFFRQDSPGAFTDVTATTKLPKAVLDGSYTGAWAVDIEADGDLDVVLGSANGAPSVLRNNGDGTFTPIAPFAGVNGVREFVWADLHGEGNPDASMIDPAGHLHVFSNGRLGHFVEIPVPASVGEVKAIAAADASHNGVLDLLVVRADGAILRLALKDGGSGWDVAELARVPDAANFLAGEVRLHAADMDNNGANDLVLGRVTPASGQPGALLWLGKADSSFEPVEKVAASAAIYDDADLSSSGRLDLLGIADGELVRYANHGAKNYHWQIVRPRAAQATGDQRINSFGVGGEIEIRSGLLVQMQPITGPEMHFGLGEQTGVDVARILWPNGTARAEFSMKADQEVVTEQRLKGSCPFLFAYNGHSVEFVKDAVPWGSAIGLRINNLGTASIAATTEWYKIPREDLAPRDGYYDLRITGELWETYYYDYFGMMVVDHPASTNVFTDERFQVPAVKPAITAVGPLHKIVSAVDNEGHDVTDVVRDQDNRYLDTFGRGQYQGVTRDHYVEVNLGDDVPKGPLYLIARGWLHPSDSSVNVAMGQGSHEQPHPLSLEVPDGHGGWMVARANLGFPAGRKKICLFDLTGLFRRSVPHKVRLRTNLEIYWDSIEWAQGLPETPLKITLLAPEVANLHYRGYSVVRQANASSPEIPDYNELSGARHPWRDLEGYYTRYGDVRELLAKVDDRYVIMNAGDEMSFRFAVPSAPPAGWVRDYVIAGDGWVKDGDYNSMDSKTVLPLPHHSRTVYSTPPGRLEDEWTYRHHPADWETYQTRYVTPAPFEEALRNGAAR